MIFGVGMVSGFSVASLFYSIGGYTLPFLISAACAFTIIPFTIYLVPTNKEIEDFLSE